MASHQPPAVDAPREGDGAGDDDFPDIGVPDIDTLPSMTQSTSETEEERRRILEGIFAEEDNSDSEEEEEDAMLAFVKETVHAQQQQQQQKEGVQGNRSDGAAANDGVAAGKNVEDAPGGATRSDSQQQWPQQQQLIPDEAATSTASERAERGDSGNAYFSSSSDEEEFDERQGLPSAATESSAQGAPADLMGATTPPSSNTTQYIVSEGSVEVEDAVQQPDLIGAPGGPGTGAHFSWIQSADETEAKAEDPDGEVQTAPSLSFNLSQDTSSLAESGNVRSNFNSRSASPSVLSQKLQQPPQQAQSAFDRALDEVKREGRHSRSNSFTFEGVDQPSSTDEVEDTAGGDASQGATNATDEDTAEKGGDDDFFAKAENTVLDEIIQSEHCSVDETESETADASSSQSSAPPPPPPPRGSKSSRVKDKISVHSGNNAGVGTRSQSPAPSAAPANQSGLPDVLSSMRQKIESFGIFDGDNASKSSSVGPPGSYLPPSGSTLTQKYYKSEEERESMRRAFQQSISAAVLLSLAHKRYERRRLAAMEIEKVVRSLVAQEDYSRVRAILLLLSDDYVRSTNEDARKGGAVALAACAIGLKKADSGGREVAECRDLILASVVHACQDHSQRVRYYATESLFNVTKVIPSLAVQHFFILFEILRSLYADVDLDVRSGAELLDKKLKEVIVGAINSGSFSADACVPVFARFVYMRNKATKQLTLTWLKEFSEKLIGAPILQFLHLFLGGIFAMVADPNAAIRQLALEFLQSVLPKLLAKNEDFEDAQQRVDFDKILQSLVLTMEHPDPFVRKVAMYWLSRIVQAHMTSAFPDSELGDGDGPDASMEGSIDSLAKGGRGGIDGNVSAASASVRNALPHVLPGILLSIGDTHQSRAKDSFLPDQTTHSLAEQANQELADAVRRDGRAFVPHLGGFVVALREELDSPGGLIARNPPSLERRPYRMDVKADGSGIESTGWFRASDGVEERDNALILSRLCALQWVVVLYDYVVPNSLKAEFANEFIDCIAHQLVDQPPGIIIVKSFEVLAKISSPADGEASHSLLSPQPWKDENASLPNEVDFPSADNPINDANVVFALGILEPSRRTLLSRDRAVFASLIDLHALNQKLLLDLSKVIELMCTIQPPEFVFISFAYELDNFIVSRMKKREKLLESPDAGVQEVKQELASFAQDLAFVSNFAQQLGIVFFSAPETEQFREVLKDSIGFKGDTVVDERRARLFHILLHTFSHNIVATLSFCLWGGAFLTASTYLQKIDPLDVSLMLYLEIDQLIDLIERPLFRHLHLRMLECEDDPYQEGSGAMLFRTLKSILMLLPQSTSYMILKERLSSMARYRQSAVALSGSPKRIDAGSNTDLFVKRIVTVRSLHCDAKWRNIRAESLEDPCRFVNEDIKLSAAQQRREWLGYADEEEELATKEKLKQNMLGNTPKTAELVGVYEGLDEINASQLAEFKTGDDEECETCVDSATTKGLIERFEQMSAGEEEKEDDANPQWREYWATRQ